MRHILENDNFIVAEIIKNWGDAQGKGLKTFKLSTDLPPSNPFPWQPSIFDLSTDDPCTEIGGQCAATGGRGGWMGWLRGFLRGRGHSLLPIASPSLFFLFSLIPVALPHLATASNAGPYDFRFLRRRVVSGDHSNSLWCLTDRRPSASTASARRPSASHRLRRRLGVGGPHCL